MSRLEDLIAELCPNGVEHRLLGEVGSFVRGNGLQKKDLADEGVPAIHYGQIFTYYGTMARKTKSFTSSEVALRSRRAKPGDLVIATTSENSEDVGKAMAWLGDAEAVVSSDAMIYAHRLHPLYVAYFFQSASFTRQKQRFISGTKVKRLSSGDLARISIPVPPAVIQDEIASVLEAMEELEAELEAELKAELRSSRLQYKFHRDELLDFEGREDVGWMPLVEVAREFGRGKSQHRPRNDPKLYGGAIPFIQTGDIRSAGLVINEFTQTYSQAGLAQSKLWPAGTLCITIAANIAETAILGFDSCFPDSVIGFLADPAKADVRFVEHLLIHSRSALQAQGRGSAQSNINLATFENERLPFPPINEQARIASTLDKFDSLVTDLSRELTAEIAARRKQYEYYRDKLLTFDEASSMSDMRSTLDA